MKTNKIAVALVAAACTALFQLPAWADDVKVVKIGSGAPKSGAIAHLGQDNEMGAQLAVNDINAKGLVINGQKIKLELVGEDDAGDLRKGMLVAVKLAKTDVVAVVGHLNSGVSIAANIVYSAADIVQVSPSSTNPEYTFRNNKTAAGSVSAYRVIPQDVQHGNALGQYILSKGPKSVAVLHDSTQFGKGLADYFEQAIRGGGAEITAYESMTNTTTDFRGALVKIKSNNPDYIFWGGMDDTAAALAKQMRELGLRAKLISTYVVCAEGFIELAGASAEGVTCSVDGGPLSTMKNGAEFGEHFKDSFNGRAVQIYAPYAYDAVYAIVEAMKIAKSTEREAIAAAMPRVDFEGVTGRIRFDANGDVVKGAITIQTIKQRRFVVEEIIR